MPYSFTTSTIMQYNNFQLKRLLIDSDAATWSIGGFGQPKALQRIFLIELDKTIVGSANFFFRIGSISSIGTVNLNRFLGMIIFYIVQVNTPYLLYFVDMDKLEAFFNNLIN